MRFKQSFLYNYLKNAPAALAIERSLECEILSEQNFTRPILDLGCGDGTFAFVLFDEEIDVGVDPDGDELRQAQRYRIYKEIIQCHGDSIPKKEESFNTIFCNSALEHIPDFKSVLRESHRLLAKGGRFYVTVATEMFDRYSLAYQLLSLLRLKGLAERYRRFFNKFWKHFNYYKKEEWGEIFFNSGFKVIGSKEYAPKAICLIDDFLVPFTFPSFVIKKIINRWILSKNLRRIYIYPYYLIARGLIEKYKGGDRGGIVFFSLMKTAD